MNNEIIEDSRYIDAPLKQYKNIYKDLHHKNVTEYFDGLVEKSGINTVQNKETVKLIKFHDQQRNDIIKIINSKKSLKGFLIFLDVLLVGLAIFSLIMIFSEGFDYLYLAFIFLSVLLFSLFTSIIKNKLNPVILESNKKKQEIESKIHDFTKKAWEEVKPLNQLFTHTMHKELFQKTVPFIKLDKMFDSRRFDYLVSAYGLVQAYNKNRSTLVVQSGDIHGNPFYLCKDVVHHMGSKSYSGSITIYWTTTSVVNGKVVTNHHSQVLTATVTKPFPLYTEQTYLVYGNDAAPDLSFSRVDSDAEHLTQKQIDRMVDKDIKKLNKKTEKSIKEGHSYTVMGNQEFEVLFGATNRDHEVQFRMLFTPLAQRQLLELMKEKEIGFGDNFDFVKKKKINMIYPEHLSNIELDAQANYYHHYDFDVIKNRFIDYNNSYFRHLYFAFAPLLAIPLYQHQKPHEYMFKDLYQSHVCFYEHEHIVNSMNANEFIHPLCKTRNILKTKLINSENECDRIKVTSFGYQTENRIDYITKFGGDGKNHTIPVHWVEYLPVEKETDVVIQVEEEQKELTYQDRVKHMIEEMKKGNMTPRNVMAIGGFLATIVNKENKSILKEE